MSNNKPLILKIALYAFLIIIIILILAGNITRNQGNHELSTLIIHTREILLASFFIIFGVKMYSKSRKLAYFIFAYSILIIINIFFRL